MFTVENKDSAKMLAEFGVAGYFSNTEDFSEKYSGTLRFVDDGKFPFECCDVHGRLRRFRFFRLFSTQEEFADFVKSTSVSDAPTKTVGDILEEYRGSSLGVVVYSERNGIEFDCRNLSEFDLDNVSETSYNSTVFRKRVRDAFVDDRINILVRD